MEAGEVLEIENLPAEFDSNNVFFSLFLNRYGHWYDASINLKSNGLSLILSDDGMLKFQAQENYDKSSNGLSYRIFLQNAKQTTIYQGKMKNIP